MKQIYNNDIVVNNGLSLKGNTPLDDRLVWEGFESLYVYAESPESCPLYGKAYDGMIIIMFDVVDGEKKSYMMFLKDASPYIPGMGGSVTPQNYLDYWRQDSVDYSQIEQFVAGYFTNSTDKVVGYHGDATGMTAAQLNNLTITEVLSRILFEWCVPSQVSEPGLTIAYKSSSAYRSAVEVGTAMPKSSQFTPTFTQDVWKWVSSHNSSMSGENQVLCNNTGTVSWFLRINGSDVALDSVTSTVVEGTTDNGQIFATKPYTSTGNAKDSRNSEINASTGSYYHEGVSGTATSGMLTVTGGWRAYANAPKVYSSAENAWDNFSKDPGPMPSNGDTRQVQSSYVMTSTSHNFYLQWTGAERAPLSVNFYIWVPNTYKISDVNSVNSGARPVFDNHVDFELVGTVSVTNTLGATGDFKKYKLVRTSVMTGILTVEVKMTKA